MYTETILQFYELWKNSFNNRSQAKGFSARNQTLSKMEIHGFNGLLWPLKNTWSRAIEVIDKHRIAKYMMILFKL